MKKDSLKSFANGGMDQNSAPEFIAKEDYVEAFNTRNTGTGEKEGGYVSNIESTEPVTEITNIPAGIIKGIGGGEFDAIQKAVMFRYNSFGNNQILVYDYATNQLKAIFTDKTDSAGQVLLPLNPENYIKAILINDKFLIWVGTDLELGCTNLETLMSGGYGTVLAEDLSLIKPQCLIPPTGVYGNDPGQPANYLFGLLPQFSVQYVNADYNYSTWSTWSKRIVPYQQNTPVAGSDVTKNNYIIVSVNIGSIRATTINIARRFGTDIFEIIKSVDRSYVINLNYASVDVLNNIPEAYDPETNIYSFAYYENQISIPVTPTETDLFVDEIYPSNVVEKINGNIAALGDWKMLYDRPTTAVSITAAGYNPNIDIPVNGGETNPIKVISAVQVDDNFGNHKKKIRVTYTGIPHTGDALNIYIVDSRDSTAVIDYGTYVVPASLDGNQTGVISSFATMIPGSNYFDNGDGTSTIQFVGPLYFVLQGTTVQLFYSGATVANSIPSVLDNSTAQLAFEYRDRYGRPFPLQSGNAFTVVTPSYAQVNGQAIQIAVNILTPAAPAGAVDYQVLITKPPINAMLDVIGVKLNYISGWNAYTNLAPNLVVNDSTALIGDTYQITAASNPSDTDHYFNLGSGEPYHTGDYVVYNGQSWDVLPKSFGDLTDTGNILAFSLSPLNLFNSQYAEEGVDTVIGYDFSPGDKCTLHYYIDGSTKHFINNPCVNLSVFGYDAGRYIVKVEKSATFDDSVLDGKNVFLRLYSPAKQTQGASTTQNGTVWYEIGQRYTITNGVHDTLNIIVNDGGVYYKTRQYSDGLKPYSSPPIDTLSTDLNYSDFYASAFSSFGRPRTYYDVLEKTERVANIITSQPYIEGSKVNGLNRFYPADVYGDSNGQISASKGRIQILWQRGQVLVAIQEEGIFYIPVNEAYTVLNEQLTGQSISEKLLNNGRYETKGIGIGRAKEAFVFNENIAWMIDPNRSQPFELTIGGVNSIAGKMSKYFKSVFATAYAQGKKIVLIYNRYYNEVMVCVEADGGVLTLFPFAPTSWQLANNFNIAPSDVTATNNGAHCTASFNSTTGKVTYTPTTGYVGSDRATFVFNANSASHTVNNCLQWTAASITPTSFSFAALTGLPFSTAETSNIILVSGIDIPVPISITGGQYAINGSSFTSATGTVSNGDTVQVKATTSASANTETHCDLTLSTETERFSVTTYYINAFSFTAQTGIPVSTVTTSNTDTLSGLSTTPIAISVTGGQYSINGGAYTSVSGTINVGDTFTVRGTSSASTGTTTNVALTIGYRSANFSITTVATVYWNVAKSGLFVKDCSAVPGTSGTTVEYDVAAHTYSSTISQADADAQAQADVDANGQAYANAHGSCITTSLIGTLLVDYYNDYDGDICFYCHTAGTAENDIPVTAPENNGGTGVARYPNDGRDPATCSLLSSNRFTSGTVAMRFGVNMAYFISQYPAIDHFTFVMRGRSLTAGGVSGIYALRNVSEGHLIMPETSPGSGKYIPSVSGAAVPTIPPYSSNVVSGGGVSPHTANVSTGSPILQLDYIVSTNTLTKTTF